MTPVPGVRFRPYFSAATLLLSIGGASMPMARVLGFSDRSSFPCFIAAALLAAAGCFSWAVVVRFRGPDGQPRGLAWVAFPLAVLSLSGMLPLLVLASAPGLLGRLGSPDRVLLDWQGDRLRVEFPRLMKTEEINIDLDGLPIPPEYPRDRPERVHWGRLGRPQPRSVLFLDLEAIRRDLHRGPVRRIGFNRRPEAPQMTDEAGERLQPQEIEVPAR